MIHRMLPIRITLTAWATLITACAPVLAQIPDKPGPPPPAGNPVVAYAIAAVLIAAVCVGAMKSSKRTHLD
jgi:hypothetical protein